MNWINEVFSRYLKAVKEGQNKTLFIGRFSSLVLLSKMYRKTRKNKQKNTKKKTNLYGNKS